MAGVARSLGPPGVSVRPVAERPSIVNVVVAWELCWYRYEVDLSERFRPSAWPTRAYELDELAPSRAQPQRRLPTSTATLALDG